MTFAKSLGLSAAVALLSSGCVFQQATAPVAAAPAPVQTDYQEDRTVTAKGYGTVAAQGGVSSDQAKLMAMRAAKLDAYRNLAERLQGLRVNSVSNAAAFASQGDSVQTSAEYFLKGARVISIAPVRDGLYEAIIEMDLDNPGASVTLTPPPPPPVPVEVVATSVEKNGNGNGKKSSNKLFNFFGVFP